ncbi:hypothetical protein C8034_v001194 [Colletotrichum sidae]|uniref:Uncharacterized protein n=1 Tax=Colletotrichum sidae TaxID=1347389 RepID=A0A4V3I5G4_9PEZI|nr:hypothetical protein C8034_v001194 [Colletotrichum sidae]
MFCTEYRDQARPQRVAISAQSSASSARSDTTLRRSENGFEGAWAPCPHSQRKSQQERKQEQEQEQQRLLDPVPKRTWCFAHRRKSCQCQPQPRHIYFNHDHDHDQPRPLANSARLKTCSVVQSSRHLRAVGLVSVREPMESRHRQQQKPLALALLPLVLAGNCCNPDRLSLTTQLRYRLPSGLLCACNRRGLHGQGTEDTFGTLGALHNMPSFRHLRGIRTYLYRTK